MTRSDFHEGRRCWLLGASAGIGAALAEELARRGAQLILSARNAETLEEVAARCDGRAEILPVDVGDTSAFEAAARKVGAGGKLHAAICAAALYEPARVAEIDMERAAALIHVNILGSLAFAKLVPPLLLPDGQLALFGSVAGYFGLPGGQPYSASKAAIANLAETLRGELAPEVDVRLISPGFVRTRLTAKNDFEMPDLMEPEDAARAIAEGLAGRGFEIHFPKRFTRRLKLLRALPYGLAFRLTASLR
jgi:short-subunit dehydrogenase